MQPRVLQGVLAFLGVCLFLTGVVRLYRISQSSGTDFSVFYTSVQRYLHGQDPYLAEGDTKPLAAAMRGEAPPLLMSDYRYSPLTTALLAPFMVFPIPVAQPLWFLFSFAVLFAGLWLALAAIAPHWSAATRFLLLGLSANAVGIYWVAAQLQITTLVMGGLGLALYAIMRRKDGLLFLAGVLVTCKPTFFLPFFCLLAFRDKWRMLGAILAAAIALNVIAALPTGLHESVVGYRLAMANAQVPGSNNYPDANETMRGMRFLPPRPMETTPGTRFPYMIGAVGEHLSWDYLFSALTRSLATAKVLALACTVLSLAALAGLWWRSRSLRDDPEFLLRVFAVSICLSLLSIYHLRYDSAILVYPFLIALSLLSRRVEWDMAAMAVLSFLLAFAFTNAVTRLIFLHFVMYDNRVWLVPFRGYLITLTFLIALWGTWRYALSRQQEAGAEAMSAVVRTPTLREGIKAGSVGED